VPKGSHGKALSKPTKESATKNKKGAAKAPQVAEVHPGIPMPVKATGCRPGTVAILSIGDEVLRGEIVNSNAAFLSDHLFDTGYEILRHVVVSDEPGDIHAALALLANEMSDIVVTGGLGPTEDDRTVDVVCNLLKVPGVVHTASLDAMKQRFSAHGFEMTPNNLRQVRVPEGAKTYLNIAGLAPGFSVQLGGAEAHFMPGIPREMEGIFLTHVLPRLIEKRRTDGVAKALVRTFHVYGMGESHIDHRLAGLLDGVEGATLHFRTATPENHVKIVVRTEDQAKNQTVLDRLEHELYKRIGQGIYGVDQQTFPMMVIKTLQENQATIALAESCTAGYAGQLITSEPGASAVFLGGIMAYSNELKTQVLGVKAETLAEQGAVSELCAREMAEGLRKTTNATMAISITGVAGDRIDGRPIKNSALVTGSKPVGTVCFALASTRPTKMVTKLFAGDRERIRKAAAYFALDMARRFFG
jgi:nicotinamide-nucleotide amidase